MEIAEGGGEPWELSPSYHRTAGLIVILNSGVIIIPTKGRGRSEWPVPTIAPPRVMASNEGTTVCDNAGWEAPISLIFDEWPLSLALRETASFPDSTRGRGELEPRVRRGMSQLS